MVIISGHILYVNPRFGSIPVIEAHALPRRGPPWARWSILIAHITIYQKNISLKIIGLNEWALYKYAPKFAKIAISKPFYAIFVITGAILCVKPLFLTRSQSLKRVSTPREGPTGSSRWRILIAHIPMYPKNIF